MRPVVKRAWPLRHRLLAALLGLCAAGLAAFATASVLLLDRSLLARVDAQLAEAAATFGRRPLPPPPSPARGQSMELPTQFRVAFYDSSGVLLRTLPPGLPDEPAVPAAVVAALPRTPVTVPARTGTGEWRVLVRGLPDGARLAVSISLSANQATVHQILVIETAVGGLVLLLLGALALSVVRLGLRPLTRMERTAEAIAGGDLDRRVSDTDPGTETGRLGGALNVMLERLATALRESERSERRLRHFVADASHELRTPLTSIRGFAELYHHGQGARDPAAERLLSRIEAEAERMGVLVEDMLLLARLDQEPALETSVVDLRVLAGDVVHAAQARDRERPIRLLVSEDPVFVLGDEHRLHQVLANLVGNAVEHTAPDAEVRVTVAPRVPAGEPAAGTARAGSGPAPDAGAALVEVRDEGQGIDPEHLPYVFDRFYRADAGRSRDSGGTGLGLAIAAALVRAHDGRIEVTGGRGATFRVLLPLHRPRED
ncbi:HAMP domain-containing histidine kinase [Actinomadura sp. ATCC 31491]|uniref:histidine kinase n=1 Tax=Actinomadura luzonensis TaxID=2805427 RepID=A0ABT0G200_9ACTN|nr:HAMP domain-containing sensor histidine kinase [Actinomadura luzonensis]MCK2218637.1 HAMP domain-containing histidine kinase [Actinomadura luzonensis]